MNNSKSKMKIILLVIALLIVMAVVTVLLYQKNKKNEVASVPNKTTSDNKEDSVDYTTISYDGKKYHYNTDLKLVLFLGIDQREPVSVNGYEGTGGRSDTIILLIMNKKEQTVKMLEISRDAMTDVDIYDQDGAYFATDKMQITMQYAFGDGEKKSCWLSKKAVSNLLYEIPIQSYISMNLDGIAEITNALGGVPLTVPKDYSALNEQFIQGKMITLDGEMAERYVRYRDIEVTGSNNERMERQQQFIMALVARLKENLKENTYTELFKKIEPYVVTDLDAQSMKALGDYELDPEVANVPGEVVEGQLHDEYVVDNVLLKELLIKLLYIQE
ncbi:MAG: LCP family protein [Lachnospiraceae bacterium]|nr:LCP family protein [Lachnospiraceae bacterium]